MYDCVDSIAKGISLFPQFFAWYTRSLHPHSFNGMIFALVPHTFDGLNINAAMRMRTCVVSACCALIMLVH